MATRTRCPFTQEEKDSICQLWQEGYSAKQICDTVKSLSWRKPQTLYPVLTKAGLYKKKKANDRRRFEVDDHYFDVIDTEHKAYWLGFLLADGFITESAHSKNSFGMTLKADDRYILEQLRADLNSTYKIHEYDTGYDWGNGFVQVRAAKLLIRSKGIVDSLKRMGFTTNKSYQAKLPLEWVPEDLVHHLIRGYFDGDGSLSKPGDKKNHTYDLKFTGTTEVIKGIRSILGKENVKLSYRYPDRDNNNCSLNLCGDHQNYLICKWMYQDATIYLTRKYERFKQLEQKYNIL